MPISPKELNILKESDKEKLNKTYSIIDKILKERYNGEGVFISTEVLPNLSNLQKEELIKDYQKVGWRNVYFSSDRDGNYLYINN